MNIKRTSEFLERHISRYLLFKTTRGSLNGGYGKPVTITALPLMSAKSSPSDTLPRQTAINIAPLYAGFLTLS